MTMKIEPYRSDELNYAYCCHVYYRWQSYCRKPNCYLAQIDAARMAAERPDIHILNMEANDVELALLASLRPTDSIAIGASKIKGGASKILRESWQTIERMPLLGEVRGEGLVLGHAVKQLAPSTRVPPRFGAGYFACTVGPRTSDQLDRYLNDQCQHHGYHNRPNPPLHVRTWSTADKGAADLQANHSRTIVRWHLVISTWNRKGTFSAEAAEAVTDVWERRFDRRCVQLRKVSFLPDHVHLAVATHPSVIPANMVLELLNSSQDVMFESFDRLVIATGNRRVWKPSAYIGTYGDVSNRQVQSYLRHWREGN